MYFCNNKQKTNSFLVATSCGGEKSVNCLPPAGTDQRKNARDITGGIPPVRPNAVLAEVKLCANLPAVGREKFGHRVFTELKDNFNDRSMNRNDGTTSEGSVIYFDVDIALFRSLLDHGVKRIETSTDVYYDTQSFCLAKEKIWIKDNSRKGYQMKRHAKGNGKTSPILYQKKIGLTECKTYLTMKCGVELKDLRAIATFQKTRVYLMSGMSISVLHLDYVRAYRIVGSIKNLTQYYFMNEEFGVKHLRPAESKMAHMMKIKYPGVIRECLYPTEGGCSIYTYNPVTQFASGKDKHQSTKKDKENIPQQCCSGDALEVDDVFQFLSQ